MSEAATTTDTAGVNRTSDGQITTAPVTEQTTTPAALTTTTTPAPTETTPKPETDAADPDKSLLNKDAPKAADKGAPETYADYTVPEGFTLDPAVKTDADKLFKEAGLTQEQAQAFVDFYTAKAKDAFEQPFKAFQDQRKEWRSTAEADPELRGKLGPGGEVLTTIAKALDGLNDAKLASEFRQAMDYTGAGDNPAFIKAFFLMAQRLTEGSHVAGRGPSPAGQGRPGTVRTPAGDLWPNLPSAANQR